MITYTNTNKYINNEDSVIYRMPMTPEKNKVMKIFWPPLVAP